MEETHQLLQDSIEKRDRVKTEIERLKGRLEEAQNRLKAVEEKCRERKLEPSKLDAAIKKLEEAYVSSVEDFNKKVSEAEEALAPFLSKDE